MTGPKNGAGAGREEERPGRWEDLSTGLGMVMVCEQYGYRMGWLIHSDWRE